MTVKTQDIEFIAPLFTLSDMSGDMGKVILEFTSDDYNKKLGSALIDADNDSDAIATFLNEYKDSADTLRSYSKEIERLFLWCI